MKPSSLSTWATLIFSRVAGMSTKGISMRLPLRMRVSMSASVSVIMVVVSSPARLFDARNQPAARHVAEADAADAELAVHGPRSATQPAAQTDLDAIARRHELARVALFGFLPHLGPMNLEGFHLVPELHVLRFDSHGSVSWKRSAISGQRSAR